MKENISLLNISVAVKTQSRSSWSKIHSRMKRTIRFYFFEQSNVLSFRRNTIRSKRKEAYDCTIIQVFLFYIHISVLVKTLIPSRPFPIVQWHRLFSFRVNLFARRFCTFGMQILHRARTRAGTISQWLSNFDLGFSIKDSSTEAEVKLRYAAFDSDRTKAGSATSVSNSDRCYRSLTFKRCRIQQIQTASREYARSISKNFKSLRLWEKANLVTSDMNVRRVWKTSNKRFIIWTLSVTKQFIITPESTFREKRARRSSIEAIVRELVIGARNRNSCGIGSNKTKRHVRSHRYRYSLSVLARSCRDRSARYANDNRRAEASKPRDITYR